MTTNKKAFDLSDNQTDFAAVKARETLRTENAKASRDNNEALAKSTLNTYGHLASLTIQTPGAMNQKGNMNAQYRRAFCDGLVNYAGVPEKAQSKLDRYIKNTAHITRNRRDLGKTEKGDTISIGDNATPEMITACLEAAGLDSEAKIEQRFAGSGAETPIQAIVRKVVGAPTYTKAAEPGQTIARKVNGYRVAKMYSDARTEGRDIVAELIEALESHQRIADKMLDEGKEAAKTEETLAQIMAAMG